MQNEIFQVDAFTDRPFAGNPAAVCMMDETMDARWMQQVASEMNLSETAFVLPLEEGFNLRWFTPTCEVDLCGHATLAAAHVLWESGRLAPDQIARFHSRSGLLTARRDLQLGDVAWIELDFPATPAIPAEARDSLLKAIPRAREIVRAVGKSEFDYLIEVDIDQAELAAMKPDMTILYYVKARGIILTTCRTTDLQFDFVSRFFAPRCGISEDPVTGSAHCALGPWWSYRLGKNPLLAYQASPRGGVLRVDVRGDRVLLSGQAITVLRGKLQF